jgi:hypothetical protein
MVCRWVAWSAENLAVHLVAQLVCSLVASWDETLVANLVLLSVDLWVAW